MRRNNSEQNIFTASFVDLFATISAVFILFTVILVQMQKDQDKGEQEKVSAEVLAHSAQLIERLENELDQKNKEIGQLNFEIENQRKLASVQSNIVVEDDSVKQAKVFLRTDKENFEVGDTFELRSVYFHAGTSVLFPDADFYINHLAEILKKNPTMVVEIQGHIHARPNRAHKIDKESYRLSQKRADRVCDTLIYMGVDSHRLECKGYGADYLKIRTASFYKGTSNRRVEVKILAM